MFPHFLFNRRRIMLAAILMFASLTLGVAALWEVDPSVSVHSETTKTALSAAPAPQGRDEVRIALTSNGFQPQEAQHAAGTFAIAVENSIHSGDYTLRLKAADGTVLKEVQIQKGSSAFTVTLPAGSYTLTEQGNAGWVCNLTIQ